MKEYMKERHPSFCQMMHKCKLNDIMCKTMDRKNLDYLIIIPGIITRKRINAEKDETKLLLLLGPFIIIFKKGERHTSGSYSYPTLLKNKRKTITYKGDDKIEMEDGTVAKLDKGSNGRVYEVNDDLKKIEKQKSSGVMEEVEPTLIDIENEADPNLVAMKVNDTNVRMECVYCGRGHISIMKEISSALTFCNVDCQMDFYLTQ